MTETKNTSSERKGGWTKKARMMDAKKRCAYPLSVLPCLLRCYPCCTDYKQNCPITATWCSPPFWTKANINSRIDARVCIPVCLFCSPRIEWGFCLQRVEGTQTDSEKNRRTSHSHHNHPCYCIFCLLCYDTIWKYFS
jgi:hypothetical protein